MSITIPFFYAIFILLRSFFLVSLTHSSLASIFILFIFSVLFLLNAMFYSTVFPHSFSEFKLFFSFAFHPLQFCRRGCRCHGARKQIHLRLCQRIQKSSHHIINFEIVKKNHAKRLNKQR